MRAHLASLVLVLALPTLSAQSTILAGTTTRSVEAFPTHLHNLAMAGDGSMWTAVLNPDGSANTSDTRLMKSADGGKTWTAAAFYPTSDQIGRGGIYIGDDGFTLHAAWTDGLTNGLNNLMYQTFDTIKGTWIGTTTVVQPATATYSWFVHDLIITRAGTVVIGGSTGAGGGPGGIAGQSTVLFIKKHGAAAFSSPLEVSKSITTVVDVGRLPILHAEDEVLHVIYRTKRSATAGIHFGFSYRSFDLVSMTFQQANDIHIGPNDNAGVDGGQKLGTALDSAGDLYCVYVSPGKLRLAYAPSGKGGTNAGWTDTTVVSDAGLLGGNSPTVHYSHFGVARGPGRQVFVIYSKLSESHKNLYIQTFIAGKPLLPPPANNELLLRSSTENNSFTHVNADSDTRKLSNAFVVFSGTPTSAPQGLVQFLDVSSEPARTVELGLSCQGSLTDYPRLYAEKLPLIGSSFDVVADQMPGNAPLFLTLAPFSKDPIELGFMGASKCYLYNFGSPLIIGLAANATGTLKISTVLPNNPALRGTNLHLQAAVIASANPAGLITSNSLGVFF